MKRLSSTPATFTHHATKQYVLRVISITKDIDDRLRLKLRE